MRLEREGRVYWAPDDATTMDENGVWQIDNSQLVPWDQYKTQLERDKLEQRKVDIQTELSNIEYADPNIKNKALLAAVEQYNNEMGEYEVMLENELADLEERLK